MPATQKIDHLQLTDVLKIFSGQHFEPYHTVYSLEPLEQKIHNTIDESCELTRESFGVLINQYKGLISKPVEEYQHRKEFRAFVKMLIPGMRLSGMLSYITKPFGTEPIFMTDSLMEILHNDSFYLNTEFKEEEFIRSAKLKSRVCLLKECYGLDSLQTHLFRIHITDNDTNLSRFFQVRINNDYVQVEFKNGKPELDREELNHLMENLLDDKLWNVYFPKDSLSFKGFSTYTWEDVTELETINRLSLYAKTTNFESDLEKCFSEMNTMVRDYFQNDKIDFGSTNFSEKDTGVVGRESFSLSGIAPTYLQQNWEKDSFSGNIHNIIADQEIVVIHDLRIYKDREYEGSMLKNGYECVVLAPLFFDDKLEVLLEFGCKNKLFFDHHMLEKIEVVCNELSAAYKVSIDFFKNRLAAVIQEEFTAIHPSVQWRFEQVVSRQLNNSNHIQPQEFEPIVFDNLTPLYGQADIISSSKKRNDAIQHDLLSNLKAVKKLLTKWKSKANLFILDDYLIKVNDAIDKVETNFSSSDESVFIHLLTEEIHPYIKSIVNRYDLDRKAYNHYIDLLDAELNIIYHERKKFEESVSTLNATISEFIDKEDNQMQQVLPHYFEKYKTDGVEYNMYVGKSILKDGKFCDFDIKEFKIWQLVNMCQVVRLVDEVSPTLSLPLETAQLIFVYNSPLSIRFRVDEKKFDVDGTYNIRYEILKKRIDKAYIKGTRKRLTTNGKIAIVYLSDEDRAEYQIYLNYLLRQGYITDEIEDLELDRMQGIEGLKALRITVKK